MLPDNRNQYRSVQGALMSLITLMVIVSYSAYKIISLGTLEEYKVQVRTKDNFYDVDDMFGSIESDFFVAAGLSSYDGDVKSEFDPQIGELKFFLRGWSNLKEDENSEDFFFLREIPT